MINQILSSLGLMKIKRAENITANMHKYYVRCINHCVEQDFGEVSAPNALSDAEIWWRGAFENLISVQSEDVRIVSEAKFLNER